MKKTTLFLLFGLSFTINTAKGQSYQIQTFEGKNANIRLLYKPGTGILSIGYLHDSIFINNYVSVNRVKVLNNVFLEIDYAKRAGSNEDASNKLLLYVRNGKLHQPLHIASFTSYDMRPNEYSLFKLKGTLLGQNIKTYKLKLNIHSENSSADKPKANYKYDKIKCLSYDQKIGVFYNRYEHVEGTYAFHNLDNKKDQKIYIKNNIPIIIIEKDKYYYLNGEWFTKEKNNFYSFML